MVSRDGGGTCGIAIATTSRPVPVRRHRLDDARAGQFGDAPAPFRVAGHDRLQEYHLHHPRRLADQAQEVGEERSEEHTSELQSLMRISYAVFCFKKKK